MQADLSTNPKCMYLIFISVDKKKISVHSSVKANNKQGNWRDKILLFISTTYLRYYPSIHKWFDYFLNIHTKG